MTQMCNDTALGLWPQEDIESVSACPICAAPRRHSLHEGVEDTVFHCAPGRWNLHKCLGCGAAYLDPRPTSASIGRAYASYYTHTDTEAVVSIPRTGLAKLRRALTHGYLNHRYGAHFQPAASLGWLAMQTTRGRKAQLDREYRHLPRLLGKGEKLLDIGCGDGAFLERASQIGWEAWGVEPDAKAAASLRNPQVLQGSLPHIPLPDASFDYITLSHVIEHLHDPLAALKEIHRLLKPGGRVWIATPNINSLGHHLFGKQWIGLQSPTHLVLFSHGALRQAFSTSGFQSVVFMPMHRHAQGYFGMSHCLLVGMNPFTESDTQPRRLRFMGACADMVSSLVMAFREEIVSVAQKVDGA